MQHPPYYKYDYRVKDDYYYTDFGHHEMREKYDTKGEFDTHYVGYDYKPAGHQKFDYVIHSEPVKIYGYEKKGYDKKEYEHKGYEHKGYKKSKK